MALCRSDTRYVNVTPWETWHYTLFYTHNNDLKMAKSTVQCDRTKKEWIVVHKTFLGKSSYVSCFWPAGGAPLNHFWFRLNTHNYFPSSKPTSNCSCKHPQPSIRVNEEMLQGWNGPTEFFLIDRLNYFLQGIWWKQGFYLFQAQMLKLCRLGRQKIETIHRQYDNNLETCNPVWTGGQNMRQFSKFQMFFCFGRCVFTSWLGPIPWKSLFFFKWLS